MAGDPSRAGSKPAGDFSIEELMTVYLCRQLVDGEHGVIGGYSQIPRAACRMAQLSFAPNLCFMTTGIVNPNFQHMAVGQMDYRFVQRCEMRLGNEKINDYEYNRKCFQFAFWGGLQVDKYGNLNLAFVGNQKRPKFRGPGCVGHVYTWRADKGYLFFHRHDPRLFVEKVSFISGPGFLDGREERTAAGVPIHAAPRLAITPLCVFDFDESSKTMRLKSLHPGRTVEEVIRNTGFAPIVPARLPETPTPTREELDLLRRIDAHGTLRGLVKSQG